MANKKTKELSFFFRKLLEESPDMGHFISETKKMN